MEPLMSMFKSDDLNCRGEATRAIANLTANADIQNILIEYGVLEKLIVSLKMMKLIYFLLVIE